MKLYRDGIELKLDNPLFYVNEYEFNSENRLIRISQDKIELAKQEKIKYLLKVGQVIDKEAKAETITQPKKKEEENQK